MARETDPETDFQGIIADIKRAEKILNERMHDLTARHKRKVEVEYEVRSTIGARDTPILHVKVYKEET